MHRNVSGWSVALVVYTAVLFVAGTLPGGGAPIHANDKVMHALAYAGQCALCMLGLARVLPRFATRLSVSVAVSAALGALLEVWQSALPHRSAELGDFVADVLGATAAAVVMVATHRLAGGRSTRSAG